jgi:serine protease Do
MRRTALRLRWGWPLIALLTLLLNVALSHGAGAGEPGFVGLHVQDLTPGIAKVLGLNPPRGVMVRDIALKGPANHSGVRRGDVIVAFSGKKVTTVDQIVPLIKALEAGQTAALVVWRQRKEVTLSLTAVKWPPSRKIRKGSFTTIPNAGLTLAALTEKVRKRFGIRWSATGVVVTLVDKKKTKGLSRGDVIRQVNQKNVWRPAQVAEIYDEAKKKGQKSVLLLIEGTSGFRFSVMPVK